MCQIHGVAGYAVDRSSGKAAIGGCWPRSRELDPYPHKRPTPWRSVAGIRFKYADWIRRDTDEVVAVFGQANLIKGLDGKAELRGGTAQDRVAAKEWIALFGHEAVLEK